jgi:hypothetical protein
MSIRDGLHKAAIRFIEEQNIPDSTDSFFKTRTSSRGSGLKDLSVNHDKYLYRNKKKVKKS